MDSKAPVQQQPMQYTEKSPMDVNNPGWNNDLFDCFSGADNLCLKATFCPCFVYGKNQARLRDPTLAGYERINQDCLMWCGINSCCGLGWIFSMMQRTEVRSKFSITNGDGMKDCLAAFCCNCCSIIQNEKEIIGRQAAQMGGVNTGGYVAPGGMVAGPQ